MELSQSLQDPDVEQDQPVLAIMGRFFPFDPTAGISLGNATIYIEEIQNQSYGGDSDNGGTGLNVWDGALLLARYLEKKPELIINQRILELGSGCGVVGIAAGVLGAKEVVMTDLSYALPLMKKNAVQNEHAWKRNGVVERNYPRVCQRIECIECDWFKPPPMSELFGCKSTDLVPDVILVADCVWLSSLIEPLFRTLQLYTRNPSTKVIITYQQRGRDTHEEFWKRVHNLFEEVADIDTERSVGLSKPDAFHVLECCRNKLV